MDNYLLKGAIDGCVWVMVKSEMINFKLSEDFSVW